MLDDAPRSNASPMHRMRTPGRDDDDDDDGVSASRKRSSAQNAQSHRKETQQIMQETLSTVSEVVPPANQPTDSWVDLAKNEEHVIEELDDDRRHRGVAGAVTVTSDDDYEEATVPPSSSSSSLGTTSATSATTSTKKKHSFLAPLADLINFGPPCLTGKYNTRDHAFDLIATCSFEKGEEVTFWYSSDCADVIIANFGFLHPLVPPCEQPPPPDDEEDRERKKSEEWKDEASLRERELWEVYGRMDVLKEEMAVLESRLERCECEEDGEVKRGGEQLQQQKQQQRMDSMTGGAGSGESAAVEANHKVRIRGRINEQAQLNQEMMEELG
mmetsp:Transcript_31695/g.58056  ORF Transcript_31695/g.58056 Transcript_31695/m.58056 type:complete len:329 (-) Transcript_31695:97-1083(-)